MKQSSLLIFILFIFSIFLTSCAWNESANTKEKEKIQQEISRLQNLYAKDFKAQEAVFEGVKVYRENNIVNKEKRINSVAYYYINASGEKINHGLAKIYCDKDIIIEVMYSNGIPNYYMFYKLPQNTLQIVFKEGKPKEGTLPVGLHNEEILGIDFKNGIPLKATLFKKEGTVKEIIFDVSNSEMKNDQPWNGEFLSIKARKIEKYVDGKIVSAKDCESLGFIEEIIEKFNKNSKKTTTPFNNKAE